MENMISLDRVQGGGRLISSNVSKDAEANVQSWTLGTGLEEHFPRAWPILLVDLYLT